MIDLKLIRVFEAVCRRRSFSEAALELHLSQSAVSKSVRSLEALWGVALLRRSTRRVAPTEAGQRLYSLCGNLLASVENVRETTIGGGETLRIACGPAPAELLLGPTMEKFVSQNEGVRVDCEILPAASGIEGLLKQHFDVIVYPSDALEPIADRKRVATAEVFRDAYVLASRRDKERSRGRVRTSRSDRYAFSGHDAGVASHFKDIGRRFPDYWLPTFRACLELAAQRSVVAVVPRSLALEAAGALRLSEELPSASLSFSVASAADAFSSAEAKAFVRRLRRVA